MIKTDLENRLTKKYQRWLNSDKPIPKKILNQFREDSEIVIKEKRLKSTSY